MDRQSTETLERTDPTTRTRVALLLVISILALVFFPFILHGGFAVDDWGVVREGVEVQGFWQNYSSWFPLFSNRPIAPAILSATGVLFGDKPLGYILVHLTFWFAAIAIASIVMKQFLDSYALIFGFLAALPVMASTVIFSPGEERRLLSYFGRERWKTRGHRCWKPLQN